jgi:hypothetical protein
MRKKLEELLFEDLVQIIEQGKHQVAAQVNSIITITYWHVGQRINHRILKNVRAEYGKEIVVTVSQQLVSAYAKALNQKICAE